MSEDAESLVRFTAKELLARLDVKLDELNRKLDEEIATIKTRVEVLENNQSARAVEEAYGNVAVKDHEGRLRSIEKKVYILSTAAALGGGVVGPIIQQILGG